MVDEISTLFKSSERFNTCNVIQNAMFASTEVDAFLPIKLTVKESHLNLNTSEIKCIIDTWT